MIDSNIVYSLHSVRSKFMQKQIECFRFNRSKQIILNKLVNIFAHLFQK